MIGFINEASVFSNELFVGEFTLFVTNCIEGL